MARQPDPVPAQTPAANFDTVYQAECEVLRKRREHLGAEAAGSAPLTDLRGLALSGGGIRSATFCLGVLQELARSDRLSRFDYLSTVSGGGFIGGWWSAWLSRPQREANRVGGQGQYPIFPPPERLELDRQREAGQYVPDGSLSAGSDPIHHVRLFSNYLTPRKGGLSADTWRATTIISRNLVLTILTLLPILASAIFFAQLYFVADSNLAATFVCGAPPRDTTSSSAPVLSPVCESLPHFPVAIIALIGVALATVVGLGWMIDPNYLSLHTFYKSRLVRAYLGASNTGRRNSEITDSADGDDFALWQLATCERGGPYHLINTTLNLVAGRDLATAQRSSAAFTLSAGYSGSLRTQYRPTRDYMGGKLTLGAALAVSGAAASPNMGSKTTSAAQGMLLALLNLRLGYWAPNPAKGLWAAVRPRLWPFYILQEFLSQTNDLSSYCYLTDGGHFDNTGIYSLVQRGCRTILLVDCGADPRPCFADLGDAIRRCRIDFGADITLTVKQFTRKTNERFSKAHFAVGSIVYALEHATALGWKDCEQEAARTGTIVWIKPSLHKQDPAEVQQYALENGEFPQQATTDQWFDEAQFESYRKLGMTCAAAAMSSDEVSVLFPPSGRV